MKSNQSPISNYLTVEKGNGISKWSERDSDEDLDDLPDFGKPIPKKEIPNPKKEPQLPSSPTPSQPKPRMGTISLEQFNQMNIKFTPTPTEKGKEKEKGGEGGEKEKENEEEEEDDFDLAFSDEEDAPPVPLKLKVGKEKEEEKEGEKEVKKDKKVVPDELKFSSEEEEEEEEEGLIGEILAPSAPVQTLDQRYFSTSSSFFSSCFFCFSFFSSSFFSSSSSSS